MVSQKFLIPRSGRIVIKIYSHFTFEQERFKRNFILINQHWRQNAKKSVENDFFKLLSNANFDCNCRNNFDNCFFEPISDKIAEITYIKKYYNLFEKLYSSFVRSDLIKAEIEKTYNDKYQQLKMTIHLKMLKLIL